MAKAAVATSYNDHRKRLKCTENDEIDKFSPIHGDHIIIQFVDPGEAHVGDELDIPVTMSKTDLEDLLNSILKTEEKQYFSFTLEDAIHEITQTIEGVLKSAKISTERVLKIFYHPLEVFTIKPVTRCICALQGHSEAVLCVAFSPDSSTLVSGSGDCTVRIWDLCTEMPLHTCTGHTHWVLNVCWSPTSAIFVSAGMDKNICVWDPNNGRLLHKLTGHSQAITCIVFQPMHLATNGVCLLASGAKDCSIRVWNPVMGQRLYTLTSHTHPVTKLCWSGEEEGFIYSASRDRTIKVWDTNTPRLLKDLKGHAHWINSLSLNTESVMKSGPFDHRGYKEFSSFEEMKKTAQERYDDAMKKLGQERLLSGSDDLTMYLWNPKDSRKPVNRMAGHLKIVNHVCFSPDGRFIASASFDRTIRIWNGRTGKYISTLRGHVSDVYQISWSIDCRMLVSASKDSTVKVWDVGVGKLKEDLSGHADEVYAVDWSSDGSRVASGSKDRTLRVWRH
eukprot:GHVL01022544.1.p1 GENE.GHVL01022544.1~~GHVL01022544.1.p1  ORF type:complete len:505 (-),score=59.30 GHVL01022544.1:1344-2858(-)